MSHWNKYCGIYGDFTISVYLVWVFCLVLIFGLLRNFRFPLHIMKIILEAQQIKMGMDIYGEIVKADLSFWLRATVLCGLVIMPFKLILKYHKSIRLKESFTNTQDFPRT